MKKNEKNLNPLLKDSSIRTRHTLQSVRSYLEQEDRVVPLRATDKMTTTVADSPERSKGARPERYAKRIREFTESIAKAKQGSEIQPIGRKKTKRIEGAELPQKTQKPEQRITFANFLQETKNNHSGESYQRNLSENSNSSSRSPVRHEAVESYKSFSGVFSNPSWRTRVQRSEPTISTEFVAPDRNETKSRTEQSTSPLGTPKPLPVVRTEIKSENQTQTQAVSAPQKLEVSTNFVRKDLKSRGSYKFRSKSAKDRRLRTKEILLARESASGNTHSAKQQDRMSGLATFGLDPLQLFLDHSFVPKESERDRDQVHDPLCPGHQIPAKLFTVKKSGPNKGRKFYSCSYPFDQRCKFFLWAEDNPMIIENLKPNPSLSYFQASIKIYRHRIQDFDAYSLREEVTRINKSLEISQLKSIPKSGKKEELIENLIEAISRLLGNRSPNPDLDPNESDNPSLSLSHESDDPAVVELSDCESDDVTVETSPKLVSVSTVDSSELVQLALRRSFGLNTFRPGQEWAINRVLARQSSLLVLPTGSGKTLTFLLPTLLCAPRDGVTIVVSPLVALMRDQMSKLPFNLPAACLSGEMTATDIAKVSDDIISGYFRLLFVSPERLCTPSFQGLLKSLKKSARHSVSSLCDDFCTEATAPRVGLLCIDEAHCLSQWSFNFRPSFLRIHREIQRIQPTSVLALTATAPPHVQHDIVDILGIPSDGVLVFPPNRPNLSLYAIPCSGDEMKSDKILQLISELNLSKSHTKILDSVIVYVWRRDEADRLGEFLKSHGISAQGYHAGMSSSQRQRLQYLFDKGTIQVIVATIAFGMGIDKSNVRLVIHHSIPKDIESYLQEVGRAGRDGIASKCVLLLSSADVVRQHNMAYSNSTSALQVYVLLTRVFRPLGMTHQSLLFQNKVAFDLEENKNLLDMPGTLIESVFSLLERPPYSLLNVEGSRGDLIQGILKISAPDVIENDPIIRSIREIHSSSNPKVSFPNFEVSLLQLSLDLQMTPEILAGHLYQRQSRGIIAYNISHKCFYLDISSIPVEAQSSDSDFREYCEQWLWKLAIRITNDLDTLFDKTANRAIEIWKFGHLLPEYEVENIAIQTQVMGFLSDYMANVSEIISESEMARHFSTCPIPLLHEPLLQYRAETESEKVLKCCRQISILAIDPSVQELIDKLSQSIPNNPSISTVFAAKLDLKARLIAKILIGISSSLIQVVEWENRAQWKACHDISFPTIVSLCRSYLEQINRNKINQFY